MGKPHGPNSSGTRRPQGTVLQEIIREHFADYMAHRASKRRKRLPDFVVRDFTESLSCGDPASGCATMYCIPCDDGHVVVFSCKRRGFCARCLERRQKEQSRILQERVLGDTPVRQWVKSLPSPLRNLGPFGPDLSTAFLADGNAAVSRHYKLKAKRELGLDYVNDARTGSATAIHLVSADLRSNLHYHGAFADGVFVSTDGGPLTFHEVSAPTREELEAVSWDFCRRVVNTLKKRGLWEDAPSVRGDPEGTYTGRVTIGPQKRRRVRLFAVAPEAATAEAVADNPVVQKGASAFSVWAGKRIDRGQRKALRRLLQYMLSPPFTDDQLTRLPDGRVVLQLKRPRRDGSTTRVFTPFQLFDKLAALPPRRKAKLVRFHGIYAPNAKRRAEAVPQPVEEPAEAPVEEPAEEPAAEPTEEPTAEPKEESVEKPAAGRTSEEKAKERAAWAELLKHVHEAELRRCPRCGGPMHLLRLKSRRLTYERSRESIRASQRWRSSG